MKLLHLRSLILLSLMLPFSAQALDFAKACEKAEDSIIIGAVGDFISHGKIQRIGYEKGFESFWRKLNGHIQSVDIMYGNLETPVANQLTKFGKMNGLEVPRFDDVTYSGYPMFNAHDSLVDAIVNSGFDIVSTANNHSMDRYSDGINLTIEALLEKDLAYVGTRRKNSNDSFITYMDNGKRRIAFVACTFSVNGVMIGGKTDPYDQVLECYREKSKVLEQVRTAAQNADAVIVTPHWGVEYTHTPSAREKTFGRELLDNGATAVIGTHPHVIQPIERYVTKDGREGAIIYSTGNFISNQPQHIRRIGLLAYVGLSFSGNQAWINGVRYTPIMMGRTSGSQPTELSFIESTPSLQSHLATVRGIMKNDGIMLHPDEKISTNSQCKYVNH